MTDTSTQSADRLPNGRFQPGHSMGGRPFGSRNRVSRKMLLMILKDFETHHEEFLYRLRSSYTPMYFNALARIMPQMAQTEVSDFEDLSDAQAARLATRLRQMFAVTPAPRTALAELEAILAQEQAADGAGQPSQAER